MTSSGHQYRHVQYNVVNEALGKAHSRHTSSLDLLVLKL